MDNYARTKLIVKTTLLHARETAAIVPGAPPVELAMSEGQSLEPGTHDSVTKSAQTGPTDRS